MLKASRVSPVDAAGEGGWLVEAEARGEQRCVVQEPDEVLHSLVALVRGRLWHARQAVTRDKRGVEGCGVRNRDNGTSHAKHTT